jgi:hypothetical protein
MYDVVPLDDPGNTFAWLALAMATARRWEAARQRLVFNTRSGQSRQIATIACFSPRAGAADAELSFRGERP